MSFPHTLSSASGSAQVDFVHGDMAALAAHMQHCARSRGSMSGLRSAFQTGRGLVAGRLVTVAFVAFSVTMTVLAIA